MVQNVLQYGFAGILALCLLASWLSRPRRGVFLWAAFAAGAAAIGAHYFVFWATAVFGLMIIWALFCALSIIDLSWRLKAGFTISLVFGALLSIYPTYHDERHGKIVDDVPSDQRAELEEKALRGELGWNRFILSNIPFRLVRGLDLKGGLRLVYTVDVEEAIKDKRDRYYDEVRVDLLKAFGLHEGEKDSTPTNADMQKLAEKVRVEKPREEVSTVRLTFTDAADADKLDEAFLKRYTSELSLLRSADRKIATFRVKPEVETSIRERAVTQAKDTVLRRVDGMGLKEAGVTVRDEDIIIEIPGDDEASFSKIRDIISQTARLEFKMVDDEVDFFESLAKTAKEEDLPKGLRFEVENAPVGQGKTKPNHFAMLLRGEHEDMNDALKRMQEWVVTLNVPDDREIGFEKRLDYDEEKDVYEEIGWRTYYLVGKAEITGDLISDAQAQPDQSDRGLGGWHVAFELTPAGGDRFEEVTEKNLKRRFAIVLDGTVESAPVIQSKIPGGRGQITLGSGSIDDQLRDAKKLELVLRSGALPAPISPSNEQLIGPSLGDDAIAQGLKGGAAGAILVLVFMVTYYNRAGFIADIAVMLNLLLQLAILAMFGASLTLPGIAGLVLTIGIAVDANVLINERIREELRHGKSPRTAVDIGYDKAFSAILDGHVTTVIAGLILAQYGSGPIKGFAITLIVGIAVSLFTGVVCTRLMFDYAVKGRKVKNLHLG